jgi:CDP-diacylglycerol--serine O-phosphatidyltransferase
MKKHIPNFITCLNILTGALGILAVSRGEVEMGIYYVLIASFFDFFDGMFARILKVQSEFGKQMDSLADMISFGVLPSFVMYAMLDGSGGEGGFIAYIGLLIVPFSALRLAKFNLATDQSEEFKGLPTPANAIMITAIAFAKPDFINLEALILISIISSFLLVSNIPMIALKFKSMGWRGNELRYTLIISEVIGLAIFKLYFIPFIIPLYIVLSVVGNSLRKALFNSNP